MRPQAAHRHPVERNEHESVEGASSGGSRWRRCRAICVAVLIHRGFRATTEPSTFETAVARTVRDWAIPGRARTRRILWKLTSENLNDGRKNFLARCASCHGHDGSGQRISAGNLYPRAPDLRATKSQDLTDGELHYIIENGVALTGMPAWGNLHQMPDDDSWKLVLYIRSLRPLTREEQTQQAQTTAFSPLRRVSSVRQVPRSKSMSTGRKHRWRTSFAIPPAPGCDHSGPRDQQRLQVFKGPGRVRLRQHLEAALFHESR